MKKRKALTKYLGLMMSLNPQSLLGMEAPETNLKFAQNVFIHLRDTFSNRLSASVRKADV
jgi:hypothetical protein